MSTSRDDVMEDVSGIGTIGYQRALQNRIRYDKLLRNAELDTDVYTPVFVHDVLMLPGSLAQTIGKQSELEIIDRMTPAILSGFQVYVEANSIVPILVPTSHATKYARGMLVFGQGKVQRGHIREHYCQHARRAKAEVIIEVLVAVPGQLTDSSSGQRWRRQRMAVKARTWLSSTPYIDLLRPYRRWTLEGMLSGMYLAHQASRAGDHATSDTPATADHGQRTTSWQALSVDGTRETDAYSP